MSTGKDSLPRMPCQCSNPDWFHDGPCRPPPTLDSVVRSPRFYALKRAGNGWFVAVRTGAEIFGVAGLELFDGDTVDGAVAAAALRIDAVDAAERETEGRKP